METFWYRLTLVHFEEMADNMETERIQFFADYITACLGDSVILYGYMWRYNLKHNWKEQ